MQRPCINCKLGSPRWKQQSSKSPSSSATLQPLIRMSPQLAYITTSYCFLLRTIDAIAPSVATGAGTIVQHARGLCSRIRWLLRSVYGYDTTIISAAQSLRLSKWVMHPTKPDRQQFLFTALQNCAALHCSHLALCSERDTSLTPSAILLLQSAGKIGYTSHSRLGAGDHSTSADTPQTRKT